MTVFSHKLGVEAKGRPDMARAFCQSEVAWPSSRRRRDGEGVDAGCLGLGDGCDRVGEEVEMAVKVNEASRHSPPIPVSSERQPAIAKLRRVPACKGRQEPIV